MSEHKAKKEVLAQVIRSYTYVIIWMAISISVILFNKWLLAFSGFPHPITLTMWHMAFCSTVGFLCVRVLRVVKSHNMSFQEYMQRVMPIGLLYAASLWLSNSAYLYLSVSFIQMTKSLMPGLVYGCGVMMRVEHFSWGSSANMVLIAFGVLVCALGEVNLVMKGLVQQLVALGFEAARLTLVQILINSRPNGALNPLQSLYYVSPACMLGLLVPFVSLELGELVNNPPTFLPSVLLANALAAFALNLAVFLLIGKTSALTMNIAGVIKDWMLIFFSYYVFHAPVTQLNLAGYAFCCTGVAVYNAQKLAAIKKRALQRQKEEGSSGAKDEEAQPLKGVKGASVAATPRAGGTKAVIENAKGSN